MILSSCLEFGEAEPRFSQCRSERSSSRAAGLLLLQLRRDGGAPCLRLLGFLSLRLTSPPHGPVCLIPEQPGVCTGAPWPLLQENVLKALLQENVSWALLQENVLKSLLQENVPRGLLQENVPRGLLQENMPQGLLQENGLRGLLQENGPRGLLQENGPRGLRSSATSSSPGVFRNSTAMKSDIPYEKMADVERVKVEAHLKPQKYYRCMLIVTCLATVLLVLFVLQTLLVPTVTSSFGLKMHLPIRDTCTDSCRIVLVESIPVGLEFNSSVTHPSIYQTWLNLISGAQSSLDIASFYWTLTNEDTGTYEPTANQGERVLQELAQLSGRISVRVAVNKQDSQNQDDLNLLMNSGADVRFVNMRRLTSGVLHTKFWVVDKKHIYIGSANMDWRSLTQVKELGAVVYDCSCLAKDLDKIFEAYWFLGQSATVPTPWPSQYSTAYNKDTPMQLSLNGTDSSVYLSSSPASLCAEGRTPDLQSILSVIDDAQQFVYIAVMNYLPTTEFTTPKRYWADIDTALRRAAFERKVRVRLLISCWSSSSPVMFPFLRSLASVQDTKSKLDIQVDPHRTPTEQKIFIVPVSPSQKEIPYARVNHNKYMVTDKVAYIGTSNWSGDYFLNTAGSALVVNQTSDQSAAPTVQQQLQAVFERDWDSSYSTQLKHNSDLEDICSTVSGQQGAL
ncbi:hypothetical protein NFI96_017795 [Prochilodus magdalenae]|nr:hypothetical protein NFI96_017795 [Prochilodus magdalenae]